MDNEFKLAAVFKNPLRDRYLTGGQKFVFCLPFRNMKTVLFILASHSGEIRVHNDILSEPVAYFRTDEDIKDICVMEETGTDSFDRVVLFIVHESGILRTWDVFEGSLLQESRMPIVIESLHATRNGLFALHSESMLTQVDSRTGKMGSSLTGFGKSSRLRCISSGSWSDLLGVIDCFGQFALFVVSSSTAPFFTERSFSEAFSVDLFDNTIVLLCPLKAIIYRISDRLVEPMKSVLATSSGHPWREARILSPKRIVALSGSSLTDLISEEPIVSNSTSVCDIRSLTRVSSNRFIAQSDTGVSDGMIVASPGSNDAVIFTSNRKSKEETQAMQTTASDGTNLFLLQYMRDILRAFPLSICDCNFELETIPGTAITALSGHVYSKRAVAGYTNGSVSGWMVGSSKLDFEISVSTCPILSFFSVDNNSHLWACLDASGTVIIMEKRSVLTRVKPKLLIPLLSRGYDLLLKVDCDTVQVSLGHCHSSNPELRETWSISNGCWIPDPEPEPVIPPKRRDSFQLSDLMIMSRRSSTQVDPVPAKPSLRVTRSIELIPGIRAEKSWAHQDQVVTFDFDMNMHAYPNKDLLGNLFGGNAPNQVGIVYESALSGSWQLSVPRSGSKILRSALAVTTPVGHNVKIEFLLNLISKSNNDDLVKRVMCLLIRELRSRYSEEGRLFIEKLFHDFSSRSPLVVMTLLSVAPHQLPGYRSAVREVDNNDLPFSQLTDIYVHIVSDLVQKIKLGKIYWFELDLFSQIFPFIRKLIVDKSLFHDAFCVLYSWVSVAGSDRRSKAALDALLAIAFFNPSKFGKRLTLLIKTTHEPEIPIFLFRKLIYRYRIHSIRFLSLLFEAIVLPCLDPMDYRVRKSSVEPVTELFRDLNKLFPMTAFHQAKQKFAVGTTQGQVCIYDVRSGTKWRILDGHTGPISAVGFDASGKYVCSYSATDCTARVWHLTSGGVPGVAGVVVSSHQTSGRLLSSLLGGSGGKCVAVKQLGHVDEKNESSMIAHPLNLVYRLTGVKIRWTSETDVLLIRENGQGIQIRL